VKYIQRVLIAVSVMLNVILGGGVNQSLSARNHQWKRDKRPNAVRAIDYVLGEGHCVEAWVFWKARNKW
jgi:hypothetical protein